MNEPQLLAILIIIGFFAVVLAVGGYLIFRTMTKPDSHIGARFPTDEPPASNGDAIRPPGDRFEDGDDQP